MKAAETLKNLRTKDAAGLTTEIKALQKATQQLTNTSLLSVARRDVARAKTLLTQSVSQPSAN